MHVSRNRSNGRIARVVRKRLAPVAVAALMLGVVGAGVGVSQAHAGIVAPGVQDGGSAEPLEASILTVRKSGGEQRDVAVAQDGQQAASDSPPAPGIIAVL
jgi:hypothetical protein